MPRRSSYSAALLSANERIAPRPLQFLRCLLATLSGYLFGSRTHSHFRRGNQGVIVFEYPFGRIGQFLAKEIDQVVRIDKEWLVFQMAVQIKPAPFHTVFRQRQTKTPRG